MAYSSLFQQGRGFCQSGGHPAVSRQPLGRNTQQPGCMQPTPIVCTMRWLYGSLSASYSTRFVFFSCLHEGCCIWIDARGVGFQLLKKQSLTQFGLSALLSYLVDRPSTLRVDTLNNNPPSPGAGPGPNIFRVWRSDHSCFRRRERLHSHYAIS
jgi:hypothetical protein